MIYGAITSMRQSKRIQTGLTIQAMIGDSTAMIDETLASYALTPAGKRRAILTAAASNPKTAKGEKLPFVAALLHLAPANRSGHNTCVYASIACRYACLNTAGHGGINLINDSNAVQRTRILKTKWLFEYQDHFLVQLADEISALERKARKYGKRCAIRLNGTSDLAWETLKMPDTGENIFQRFSGVQFYDYTKVFRASPCAAMHCQSITT